MSIANNLLVDVSGDQNIGIITINNPPVNAMSPGVPRQIMQAVQRFNADSSVNAMVLIGGGKGNIAGADIRFQGKDWPADEPSLRDLIDTLESSAKPVVAALGPNTLGGGLELAMACAYRVLAAHGRVGQPEVTLGIPPGAGGTQRLPRLAGFANALEMIVSGKPVGAKLALEYGVVDEIAADNLLRIAVEFAKIRLFDSHVPTRDRNPEPPEAELFNRARGKVKSNYHGQTAPLICIDCVEAASTLSFDEGIKFERQQFEIAVKSDQAAALRHAFFAERQAGKFVAQGEIEACDVTTVAVIGAGTMGTGISIALLKAGYGLRLIDLSPEALERGIARIHSALARDLEKGRITESTFDAACTALQPCSSLDAVANVDLVIEAVFEEMQVKQAIFSEIGKIADHAILATNTSYLDVNKIAEAAGAAKDRVVGMHFFSPANIMKLLEVIKGRYSSDLALTTALAVGKRAGKVSILSGVSHGFIANRMLGCYLREANYLIEEGALPQQVDSALKAFGFPMGPFAMSDLAGLDIGWANRKSLAATRDPSKRYAIVADRICELGRFGQKTGRGFYFYPEGSRSGQVDPEITALIIAASSELGIERRKISDEEIIKRCIYSPINEGYKILEQGIAEKSSDIDIAWLYGYGFPRWRGGPMFYAAQQGLDQIYQTIMQFDQQFDYWQPAPLLKSLIHSTR